MHLNDTPNAIIKFLSMDKPEIEQVIEKARNITQYYKGSIQDYQAAVLYALANQYNKENTTILEIGTGLGFSAAVMSMACPLGHVVTTNPNEIETKAVALSGLLDECININCFQQSSRDLYNLHEQGIFKDTNGNDKYDLIFIDGDHRDIKFDTQWMNYLKPKGTIIFHDYSDGSSKSPCLPVYAELTLMSRNKPFDILVKDTENNYGMAGWTKRE